MRQLFTLLLLAICSVGLMAEPVTVTVDQLTYTLDADDNTATVVSINDLSEQVIIPSFIEHDGLSYAVTAIGENAFKNCDNLARLDIPPTVTRIESYAFNCTKLKRITITDIAAWCRVDKTGSTEDIWKASYPNLYLNDEKIENFVVPEGITLAPYALYGLYIQTVTFPESATEILPNTLRGQRFLNAVNIGSNVVSIGESAFSGAEHLRAVNCYAPAPPVCGNNVFYQAFHNNVLSVRIGSKNIYSDAPVWRSFTTINEVFPTTAVDEINADISNTVVVYDINGIRLDITTRDQLNQLTSGLYIVNGEKIHIP